MRLSKMYLDGEPDSDFEFFDSMIAAGKFMKSTVSQMDDLDAGEFLREILLMAYKAGKARRANGKQK